jgi:hypothetical protein
MRRVPRPRVLRAGLEFGFSLVDHQIHRKQSFPVLKVETPAAPGPILRVLHQAANDRIGVHVVQFLFHFSRTVDVEVIESLLPEVLPFLPVFVERK